MRVGRGIDSRMHCHTGIKAKGQKQDTALHKKGSRGEHILSSQARGGIALSTKDGKILAPILILAKHK